MTTRTVADVIAEWRASPMNNDDGELASRIDWHFAKEIVAQSADPPTPQMLLIARARLEEATNWHQFGEGHDEEGWCCLRETELRDEVHALEMSPAAPPPAAKLIVQAQLDEARWWADRTSMWQRDCRERLDALEVALATAERKP